MRRGLLASIVLAILALALGILRHAPPSPLPEGAPADVFSAARAATIQRALAEAGPRPTGSDGNAKGRAILSDALSRAGFAVEEQSALSCGRHGACGFVKNVVAIREGRAPELRAVMLMAHHDSVPCSPGASDDGMGASAVVEAARALGASPAARRAIVVVLTDGEEDGLLGAEAFARAHPLAKRVGAVVNVDARGTRGASALFETSAGNAWLVSLAASRLDRPVTSSLFYEVYRRMPNDTDFTVFRGAVPGVNFANTAGIEGYHTTLDTADRADRATLQHHGEQALAMARALADADLEARAATPGVDAVWFDVLSLGIVRWPSSWSLPLALVALALALGQSLTMRAFGKGMLAAPAALGAALAAAVAIGLALRAGGAAPAPWVAHPLPGVLSVHLTAIAGGLAASVPLARRASPREAWAGTWLLWSAAAVGAAWIAPGASYLLTVPAIAAGALAWLPLELACVLSVAIASVLWMPLSPPIYDALGLGVPGVAGAATAFLLTAFVPLAAEAPRRAPLAIGAGALALAIAAAVVPRFSASHPQRVNVLFVQEGPRARAFVQASWAHVPWGEPPPAMVAAARAGSDGPARVERPLPWFADGVAFDAPPLDVPGPELVKGDARTEDGKRRVRLTIRSRRGAPTLILETPAPRRATFTVRAGAGAALSAPSREGRVAFRGVRPGTSLDVDIVAEGGEPLDLTLYDTSVGVPASSPAEAAVRARPAEATQTQDGDSTVLLAREKM